MTKLSFKGKIVAFLIFLSFLSLVYIISSPRRPPSGLIPPLAPSPTPAQIQSDQQALRRIKKYSVRFSADFSLPQLTSDLSVYTAYPSTFDLDSTTTSLAAYFGLKRTTPTSQIWVSSDQASSLIQNFRFQSITFSIDSSVFPQSYYGSSRPQLNSSLAAAQKLIDSQPSFSQFTLNPDLTRYYFVSKSDTEFQETTPQKANIISLNFEQQVSGYPYRRSNLIEPPLTLYLGQKNQIIKLTFISQPLPAYSSPTQHSPLLLPDIKTQLESGQGEVVSTDLMNLNFNTTRLPEITLVSAKIEYRFDPPRQLLIPYFLFSGTFVSPANGQDTSISILLPAVNL